MKQVVLVWPDNKADVYIVFIKYNLKISQSHIDAFYHMDKYFHT